VGKSTQSMHVMSMYIIELTHIDYTMLRYKPSMFAAAALYVTRDLQRPRREEIWVCFLYDYVVLILLSLGK
jgi:hypothetical protein